VAITILKHNVPWGPFSREQVRDALVRGDFTLHYLAHAPGLKEWLPLGEVLDYVDRGTIPPPVPVAPNLPPVPGPIGVAMPSAPPFPVQPPLLPKAPPRLPELEVAPELPALIEKPEVQLAKAPFVARFIAFIIDCFVLFAPIACIFGLGALTLEIQTWWDHTDAESAHQNWLLLKRNFQQLVLLIAIGVSWLYAAGLECSRWQATVGKLWMGLKVTDAAGERLSFPRATGRYLAKYLSALPCFLGFIMALFSSRGRALHDRLADTRVIKS
jgi:uncharacterized RDD family membrane protein YckC